MGPGLQRAGPAIVEKCGGPRRSLRTLAARELAGHVFRVRSRSSLGQLSLFSDEPALMPYLEEDRALAQELPSHVRLGTSSWTFPGWSGILYPAGTTERELSEHGLALYSKNPLFGTVGIDRSYYAPLSVRTYQRYAADLPPGFRCVTKVWSALVTQNDPRTGRANPRFLDHDLFAQAVLEPTARGFLAHQGPIVFELTPTRKPRDAAAFTDRLGEFLGKLPRDFTYAVELRNRELLTPSYLGLLQSLGVAHVLNFWERMPPIGEQLALPNILTAPTVVCRLMLPPGQRYADRVTDLAPFDRLVDPQPQMRGDVVRLVLECERLGKTVFIIVNNKAEGSSPLTVRELARGILRARRAPGAPDALPSCQSRQIS
jgi:uncharacterized protein YecE (DUF72 family)